MARRCRAIADFLRATGGNIAVSAALLFPLLLAAAALVVDEAALYHEKRQMQAAVDLAAIHAAADPPRALELAHQTLLDQKAVDAAIPLAELAAPAGPLRVQTGRYTPDPALAAGARFEPGVSPANAVAVHLRAPGTLHFARLFMDEAPDIATSALASATPRAALSIGSRLARLDEGLVNALLGQLLGTQLSLTLLDYEAIASLDIGLLNFLDALAGKIGVSAGTYGAVLGANVALADIALALAAAAGGTDPAVLDLLADLAGVIDDGLFVEMARLVAADGLAGVAVGTPMAGAAATINAFDLLTAAALLADGRRQAAFALEPGLPGIARVTAHLAVGEPPQAAWYIYGPTGSIVRTAQVRLKFDIEIGGEFDGGSGGGLGDLLGGVLGIVPLQIRLPVYAELAFAQAELAALDCPAGRPDLGTATLAVRPGVLRLAVGETVPGSFSDTASPLVVTRGTIVNVAGLARVTALADIEVAQTGAHRVRFSHADVENGTVRTVGTTTPIASLTPSLLSRLDLRLEPFTVSLGGVLGRVEILLRPVTAALDRILVTLLGVMGLSVGEADARMHGFDCRAATLVG